jgi:hypothetical protein
MRQALNSRVEVARVSGIHQPTCHLRNKGVALLYNKDVVHSSRRVHCSAAQEGADSAQVKAGY